MFPVLTTWTNMIALAGGYVESVISADMDYRLFWNSAFSSLRFSDLIVDTLKPACSAFWWGS